jgi:hypothetical protein
MIEKDAMEKGVLETKVLSDLLETPPLWHFGCI